MRTHSGGDSDFSVGGLSVERASGVGVVGRRSALSRLAGLSLGVAGGLALAKLSGCASGGSTNDRVGALPSPKWPTESERLGQAAGAGSRGAGHPSTRPLPTAPPVAVGGGVIPRSAWSKGDPFFGNMTRMQPIDRITLHHDGMSAFTNTSEGAAAERIEAIRRAHRSMPGWGDIGYHYVIDPAGRVWEARSLSWQGAHVKDQNPGNIGICLLGNYEQQRPTDTQLAAVERFVGAQMKQYGIALRSVKTHKEMAPTACPGRNLQPRLEAMRGWRGALANA
ncbi:MAG: peptidoglycan recognition protein family protein [Phycisphaerales bacterium]